MWGDAVAVSVLTLAVAFVCRLCYLSGYMRAIDDLRELKQKGTP